MVYVTSQTYYHNKYRNIFCLAGAFIQSVLDLLEGIHCLFAVAPLGIELLTLALLRKYEMSSLNGRLGIREFTACSGS